MCRLLVTDRCAARRIPRPSWRSRRIQALEDVQLKLPEALRIKVPLP